MIERFLIPLCLLISLCACFAVPLLAENGLPRRRPTRPSLYAVVLFSYDQNRDDVKLQGQKVTARLYTPSGPVDIDEVWYWENCVGTASNMRLLACIPQCLYDEQQPMWMLIETDDGLSFTLTEYRLVTWTTP